MIRLLPLLLLLACAAPAALGVQIPEGEKIPAFTRRDGAGMGPARLGKLTDAPAFSRRDDDLGRLESIAGMGLTETRSDLDPARPHKLTGIARRAVEPEELADVMRYGDYSIHPNSTFKRFAFDEKSQEDFIKPNPDRTYTSTCPTTSSNTCTSTPTLVESVGLSGLTCTRHQSSTTGSTESSSWSRRC